MIATAEPIPTAHADRPASAPLKVLHAVLSLDVGGLERVVLDLVREGRRLGQSPTVLCLEKVGRLGAEAESGGARVVCVNKQPGLRWSTVKQVRKLLEDLRPDVVHTHQAGALLYAGAAAERVGVPVVHTEHNNHLRKCRGRLDRLRVKLLGRVAGRYARRIFCVSADVLASVRAGHVYPADKTSVVYNGISLSPYTLTGDTAGVRASLGIPANAPVVGTVGRLDEVKQQDVLLRAFAVLRKSLPAAHLVLVGDGPKMAELRSLAAALSVAEFAHFVGFQRRPVTYLNAMDAFALTSRIEGMPLVILEAWAAGVPVVASRVGGIPEMVEDGRTGLLFEAENQAALVEHLSSLLRRDGPAARLADAARRHVLENFSAAAMAANYQHNYRDLLGETAVRL